MCVCVLTGVCYLVLQHEVQVWTRLLLEMFEALEVYAHRLLQLLCQGALQDEIPSSTVLVLMKLAPINCEHPSLHFWVCAKLCN